MRATVMKGRVDPADGFAARQPVAPVAPIQEKPGTPITDRTASGVAMAGSDLVLETKSRSNDDPLRAVLESFGVGLVAGLIVAVTLTVVFWPGVAPFAPVIVIASVGAAMVVSAVVYDLRR